MTESNLLASIFLHQNPVTGEVFAARLNLRQLCRLLCPACGDSLSLNHPSLLSTQVLEVLPDGKSYDPNGWQAAQNYPVLREALSLWYYQDSDGQTQGPVSCRELAKLMLPDDTTSAPISDNSRVYSTELGTWKLLSEVSDLKIALEAFASPVQAANTTGTSNNDDAAIPTQEEYDAATMAFPSTTLKEKSETMSNVNKEMQDELESFLASTDKFGNHVADDKDEDDEGYQSDGGTRYVKDWRTGNWIHEDLAPPQRSKSKTEDTSIKRSSDTGNQAAGNNKKRKAKFSAKFAKCWVYVTGLPSDAMEEEVAKFFSKAGILDLDPETQRPKVKIYRHKDGPQSGQAKGDASVCFARPESVDLALTILDEAPFRPEKDLSGCLRVERAKFEQHGTQFDGSRPQRVSNAKRKVAQLATKQAMDWDGGEYNGRLTGGLKGLRIIVLQHMFSPGITDENLATMERTIRSECEAFGAVEKITVFASNPRGVVVVKFAQPLAASDAVKFWDGREFDRRKVDASYWDGVTDYTVRNEAKEDEETHKRQEEFGNWLESQELPEEFQLKPE